MDTLGLIDRLNNVLASSPGGDDAWAPLRKREVQEARDRLTLLLTVEVARESLKDLILALEGTPRLLRFGPMNGNGVEDTVSAVPSGAVMAAPPVSNGAGLHITTVEWPELAGLPFVRELEDGAVRWKQVPPAAQHQILAAILREIGKTGRMSAARFNDLKPSYVVTASSLVKIWGQSWTTLVRDVLGEDEAEPAGVAVAPADDFDEDSARPSGATFRG